LHIGLDKLAPLLDAYENLYIDTSCGFVLRSDDDFCVGDREILYDFFVKYQDRILFGTDSALVPGAVDEYVIQSFLTHTRFIHKLGLPYDILQKIAYEIVRSCLVWNL